jgi:hypothetical protein
MLDVAGSNDGWTVPPPAWLRATVVTGRESGLMLLELTVMEQRYHAVMEVLSAGRLWRSPSGTGCHAMLCTSGSAATATVGYPRWRIAHTVRTATPASWPPRSRRRCAR